MQLILLYGTSAAFFLVVDAIALTLVLKPLFERYIGDMLRSPINLTAAAVFYLFYIAGLLYLVSIAALRADSVLQAGVGGFVFGAVAYGTYEFTNKATLKGWDWTMVAVDTTWGAVLTGATAAFGVWATRAILS
ncbi:hypothetical protein JANAI62_32140 [Jannaschia pagri]|uniref:DUF2177 domain-containing protein n=1 Tax=Jannaschia pagri TaxID=2829797 RepID=A0ABQ4NQA0_9RHOB|nr:MULTISPECIES: DUF2177 family protein [unclassified Jannaschia]GIT92549.1 hypothetical protein JANAI61_30070 [Jannaschia sp. AI_61]GIT96591.1 hypothetical protein JANAI62_32140 [Jannaschia sp. AI_62]